ncbi:hypothetical protein TFLX_00696 [Thermoflexales bacterium]|nr:hypothetical protein TFLX_00696 [Thermoflexales bacterium]
MNVKISRPRLEVRPAFHQQVPNGNLKWILKKSGPVQVGRAQNLVSEDK